MAPMQTPRIGATSGVVNGILYVAGGAYGSSVLSSVEAYNPATNTWSYKAPLPAPVTNLVPGQAGVLNGMLYVVGGWCCSGNGQDFSTVYAYDPVSDSWASKASLPSPREQASIAVVGGILYAIGGSTEGVGIIADVEAYDPSTDTWTAKAPLPVARWASVTGVVDGIIYVVAGNDINTAATTTTYAYDPSTDTWTTKAPMPTGQDSATGGVINGILYVAGGGVPAGALNTVQAYNPGADKWLEMSPMPTARFYLSSGVIGNTLYALGGTTQGAYASYYALATNEAFTSPLQTKDDCKDGGWQKLGFRNQGQCVSFINHNGN